ncbi:MAG: hypothetical protein PHF17_00360 [Arcobacteraceae bacterium]|nr:hypothetical protein [Arcobacteraceae bacterium]
MFKIEIQNPCSCVKKRKSWGQQLAFGTLEEAQKVASQMCEQGNTKFCKKHSFEVVTDGENVIINVTKATKE